MSWTAPVDWHDTLPSTMTELHRLAHDGADEGHTVVARRQSAGRGRRGRLWHSPDDAGLWMSLLLRPRGPHGVQGLGIVCGLGVHAALQHHVRDPLSIKWPNDILRAGRKVAGILLEAERLHTAQPWVVVGIGINLAPAHALGLPADVGPAVGLAELVPTATPFSGTAELATRVRAAVRHVYEQWQRAGLAPLVEAYSRVDALQGQVVRAQGPHGPVTGRVLGLTAEGGLRLQDSAGEFCVHSGEVHTVRPTRSVGVV